LVFLIDSLPEHRQHFLQLFTTISGTGTGTTTLPHTLRHTHTHAHRFAHMQAGITHMCIPQTKRFSVRPMHNQQAAYIYGLARRWQYKSKAFATPSIIQLAACLCHLNPTPRNAPPPPRRPFRATIFARIKCTFAPPPPQNPMLLQLLRVTLHLVALGIVTCTFYIENITNAPQKI